MIPMRFNGILVVFLTTVLFADYSAAQNLGNPPEFSLNPTDLAAAFRLPSFKDTSTGPLAGVVPGLQVGMRAQALGLTGQSPVDAWMAAQILLGRVRQLLSQPQT